MYIPDSLGRRGAREEKVGKEGSVRETNDGCGRGSGCRSEVEIEKQTFMGDTIDLGAGKDGGRRGE